MTAGHRLLFAVVLFGLAAAGGVARAEDTQDSPLYAYTLQTALDRMEKSDVPDAVPAVPAPEAIQAVPVTTAPHFNTICHIARTECPNLGTACPANVPTVCPWKTTFCPPQANGCIAGATTSPVVQTQCPVRQTACPGGATNCPIVQTQCPALASACPAGATNCPVAQTQCPALASACPAQQATACPVQQTQCPSRQTFCPSPVATACPEQRTQCPNRQTFCPSPVPTACPEAATQCPARQTICPEVYTTCPLRDTQCPVRQTICPDCTTPLPGPPPIAAQMSFLMPIGNPTLTNTAQFSFNANNPGVLTIRVRLTVSAPSIPNIATSVRVCIDTVGAGAGASQLTWMYSPGIPSAWVGGPGPPPGANAAMGQAVYDGLNNWWEVSAVYTGMPDSNAAFGPKKIYAQIVSGGAVVMEVQQPIEVFYDRIALNNPGVGLNAGRNWFYYWKNPLSAVGRVVTSSLHDWAYDINPGGFGYYLPAADHVTMQDAASWINDGQFPVINKYDSSTISIDGMGLGPHCCAESIQHESFHKVVYEVWRLLILASPNFGNNTGANGDPDGDGVPNQYEIFTTVPAALLLANPPGVGLHTDPNDPDTYNLGGMFGPGTYQTYGDQEVRARTLELDVNAAPYGLPMGGITVNDVLDWSSPGKNTIPPYAGQPLP